MQVYLSGCTVLKVVLSVAYFTVDSFLFSPFLPNPLDPIYS
jgi:hypothetical protein